MAGGNKSNSLKAKKRKVQDKDRRRLASELSNRQPSSQKRYQPARMETGSAGEMLALSLPGKSSHDSRPWRWSRL